MKKPNNSKINQNANDTKVILKNDLTKEQKEEIKAAFDSIDTDGSGKIDVAELKIALESIGFDSRKEETNRIIEDLDKNKDGYISYEEFLELLTLQIVSI